VAKRLSKQHAVREYNQASQAADKARDARALTLATEGVRFFRVAGGPGSANEGGAILAAYAPDGANPDDHCPCAQVDLPWDGHTPILGECIHPSRFPSGFTPTPRHLIPMAVGHTLISAIARGLPR
jgi:hypothetical protein